MRRVADADDCRSGGSTTGVQLLFVPVVRSLCALPTTSGPKRLSVTRIQLRSRYWFRLARAPARAARGDGSINLICACGRCVSAFGAAAFDVALAGTPL